MLIFKTIIDLAKLSRSDPSHYVIQDILTDFPRDPSIHGYIVLIEPGDTRIDLPELKGTLADMSWDGVWKQGGHYHAVRLTNNEFALEFIIPDSDWLAEDLRESLMNNSLNSVSYIRTPPF